MRVGYTCTFYRQMYSSDMKDSNIRKLYRNKKDTIVAGVIGGIAEYFRVDATILRLAYIFVLLITGIFPGIVVYIIAYFIMPDASVSQSWTEKSQEKTGETTPETTETGTPPTKPHWPIPIEPVPSSKPTFHTADAHIVHKEPENIPLPMPSQTETDMDGSIDMENFDNSIPRIDELMEERELGLDDLIDE